MSERWYVGAATVFILAGALLLGMALLDPRSAPDAEPDPAYYATQAAPPIGTPAKVLPTPTCPAGMTHSPSVGISSLLGASNCALEAIPEAIPIRGTPTLSDKLLLEARIDTCYGPLRGPACAVLTNYVGDPR